jgi:hypothetical protein
MQAAFEDLAKRFRGRKAASTGGKKANVEGDESTHTTTVTSGADAGGAGEV